MLRSRIKQKCSLWYWFTRKFNIWSDLPVKKLVEEETDDAVVRGRRVLYRSPQTTLLHTARKTRKIDVPFSVAQFVCVHIKKSITFHSMSLRDISVSTQHTYGDWTYRCALWVDSFFLSFLPNPSMSLSSTFKEHFCKMVKSKTYTQLLTCSPLNHSCFAHLWNPSEYYIPDTPI